MGKPTTATAAINAGATVSTSEERVGFLLVFLSALFWSFGGAIARFIDTGDSWTVVFWRSVLGRRLPFWLHAVARRPARHAGAVPRHGASRPCCGAVLRHRLDLLRRGARLYDRRQHPADAGRRAADRRAASPGCCFAKRSPCRPGLAIAAVICGVAIMVSESFTGEVSPIGDGLALLIAVVFSIATVITRRFAHVRMTPATCLGTMFAALFAATQAVTFAACVERHGFPVRLRRAQSRARPGLFRDRRSADPGGVRGTSGHVRNRARAGLGLADPCRGAVGAHGPRRRRRVRGAACPYRSRIQAPVAAGESPA